MKRRHNVFVWAGFAVVLFAALSYIPIFTRFAVTRDFPWVNLLLFAVGGALLYAGLKRAISQPEVYRGKVAGSVLSVLSILLFAFFCYGLFFLAADLPSAAGARQVGQQAPTFVLPDSQGKQVNLAQLLRDNRGALLIFYRGYW